MDFHKMFNDAADYTGIVNLVRTANNLKEAGNDIQPEINTIEKRLDKNIYTSTQYGGTDSNPLSYVVGKLKADNSNYEVSEIIRKASEFIGAELVMLERMQASKYIINIGHNNYEKFDADLKSIGAISKSDYMLWADKLFLYGDNPDMLNRMKAFLNII